MPYKFMFLLTDTTPLIKQEKFIDRVYTVVYGNHVMIKEPVGAIKFPDTQVVVEIHDGIDRPLVKVTTNQTVDLIIDSKGGILEEIAPGLWKIRCAKKEER